MRRLPARYKDLWVRQMKKFICKSCGWEITNPVWWDIAKDYEGNYFCDDCEMNLSIIEKEGAR